MKLYNANRLILLLLSSSSCVFGAQNDFHENKPAMALVRFPLVMPGYDFTRPYSLFGQEICTQFTPAWEKMGIVPSTSYAQNQSSVPYTPAPSYNEQVKTAPLPLPVARRFKFSKDTHRFISTRELLKAENMEKEKQSASTELPIERNITKKDSKKESRKVRFALPEEENALASSASTAIHEIATEKKTKKKKGLSEEERKRRAEKIRKQKEEEKEEEEASLANDPAKTALGDTAPQQFPYCRSSRVVGTANVYQNPVTLEIYVSSWVTAYPFFKEEFIQKNQNLDTTTNLPMQPAQQEDPSAQSSEPLKKGIEPSLPHAQRILSQETPIQEASNEITVSVEEIARKENTTIAIEWASEATAPLEKMKTKILVDHQDTETKTDTAENKTAPSTHTVETVKDESADAANQTGMEILRNYSTENAGSFTFFESLEWLHLKMIYFNEQSSPEDELKKSVREKRLEKVIEKNSPEAKLFTLRLLTRKQEFRLPPCEIQEPHSGLQCSCEKAIERCDAILRKLPDHTDNRSISMQPLFYIFKGFGATKNVKLAVFGLQDDLALATGKEVTEKEAEKILETLKPSSSLATTLEDITRLLILNKKQNDPEVALTMIQRLHDTIRDAKRIQEPSALYWEAAAYYLGLHWNGTHACNDKKPHADKNCSCQKIHTLLKEDSFNKSKAFLLLLRSKEYGVKKSKKEREKIPGISAKEGLLLMIISAELQIK